MPNLEQKADALARRAREVMSELQVVEAWQAAGARVELVGSLRTGLLVRRHDIDIHIYSDPFRMEAGFEALARMAAGGKLREVICRNLLDAEDCCVEWHAICEPQAGERWQIDMIHMPAGSRFDGFFEDVAERIGRVLTPETRRAILAIKDAAPEDKPVIGIRVYQAVLEGGVRDWAGFERWEREHPAEMISLWKPDDVH